MSIDRFEVLIEKKIYPIPKLMSRIGSLSLLLMMFLTVADVFLRKVFSQSILGTVEITEFLMVILVFFGLAHAEVVENHVRVDIVKKGLPVRFQNILEVITQLCCAILFMFITKYSFNYAAGKIGSGEVSQDLWIPIYPFAFLVAFGCGVLGIVLFIKTIFALRKVIRS